MIQLLDVVALRHDAIVPDAQCRKYTKLPSHTRGIVVERDARYCDVLFPGGIRAEFMPAELISMGTAIGSNS